MHASNPLEAQLLANLLAPLDVQLARIDIAGIHASHRDRILPKYPSGLRDALSRKYLATATPVRRVLTGEARTAAIRDGGGVDSWAQANIDLTWDDHRLKACKVHLAWSDGAIRDMARQCADICSTVSRNRALDVVYEGIKHYVTGHQIRMPIPERGKTLAGCVARLCDAKWWRRAIRSTYARHAEEIERELGLVCVQRGLYASDDTVARRQQQRARNRTLLSEMTAVNDLGECFTLEELSKVNVSNPSVRRAELMTRLAGFERYADARRHVGQFITLTLPSRYHCILKRSGQRNEPFDLSTAREGHKYLCDQWAKLRSYLDRRDLIYYGMRIAEPHHDGTPHWHLLLFCEADQAEVIAAGFRRYFNPENAPGDRLVSIKAIDPSKGSAVGYIAKYISKNIDGFGVGDDAEAAETTHDDASVTGDGTAAIAGATGDSTGATTRRERDATLTATRVEAWASTCGIRQFQQIKGPPVTVWREARRIRRPVSGVIEQARMAAEDRKWDRFCEVMGGVEAKAVDRPIRVYTGRGANPGAYGETVERKIKGLRAGALIVPTRLRTWTLVRSSASASPWTRVNNCTLAGKSVCRSLEPALPTSGDHASALLDASTDNLNFFYSGPTSTPPPGSQSSRAPRRDFLGRDTFPESR